MATIFDIKAYEVIDESIIGTVETAEITLVIPNPTLVEVVELVVPAEVEIIDIGVVGLGNTGGSGGAVDSVNGQTGVVLLDADDIGDGTINKAYTASEKTKLSGVATGATANDTDANLKNRANHTGSQAIASITGLQTALDNTVSVATFNGHATNTANPHAVTKAQVGLGSVDNTSDLAKPISTLTQTALDGKQALDSDLTAIAAIAPTNDDVIQRKAGVWVNRTMAQIKTDLALVKADVGLSNVDNTSDANKPVSTAQQTALNLKANIAGPTFTGTVNGITKSMVGLGSVDNTADTAKPVSTAQQTALDGKQPLDSDLTAIAAIAPANDDVIQRKAGAWINRTIAQLKADFGLTKSDVGLSNVDNTADTAKPVSTAQQTALDGKQALDSDLTAIAAIAPTNDDIIQRKAGAWINRTMAQLKTDLALTKSDVGLSNVDNTTDVAKPISTLTQAALDTKAATTVVPDGGATDFVLTKNSATNRDTVWKRMLKWFGDTVTLPDSITMFARINIPDDASDTSTWPDRFAFYFNGTRTGYQNEYGEHRARPAKNNTVASRVFSFITGSTLEFWQLAKGSDSTVLVGASETLLTSYIPLKATGGYQGVGAFRAVQATTPTTTGWIAGELWLDTSTEV